jgi:hypothetical protein
VQLNRIAALLNCDVLCGHEKLDAEVASCYAADLMSDVLAFSNSHCLLVTGLSSIQSVHTADVADCAAIILVSGKRPAPDAMQLALTKGIPILCTPRSMYEACGVLSPHLAASSKSRPGEAHNQGRT